MTLIFGQGHITLRALQTEDHLYKLVLYLILVDITLSNQSLDLDYSVLILDQLTSRIQFRYFNPGSEAYNTMDDADILGLG